MRWRDAAWEQDRRRFALNDFSDRRCRPIAMPGAFRLHDCPGEVVMIGLWATT